MSEPLAERMRPRTLDDYVGQKHLVGEGAVLRKMIDAGRISSFILWGPPGVGKTTLAQIIANKLETPFYTLSAVTSGVKDVRDVIERAKSGRFFNSASPILFIDEIHRFSKSQQDSLLGAVERGVGVGAAYRLDEGRDDVVMHLAVLIVGKGVLLQTTLNNLVGNNHLFVAVGLDNKPQKQLCI